MTATATAADNAKTRLECIYNAFAAFAEHVAPVEDVTEDSDNAEHVAPVEDVTEDSDNAGHVAPVEDVTEDSDNTGHVAPVEDVTEDSDNTGHVAPRRVWLDWLKVAAVLLFAFVLRTVSTNESSTAPSTNSRAVVDVEPLQAVEILDTLAVAPSVPVDSIQATEGDDNADTLDVAPVAPVDSIQATEGDDNADTLDVAPVDSIQATEGDDNAEHVAPVEDVTEDSDNADTLAVAPVAPADSIQATEYTDNADTLAVAPVAPDNINQMQGTTAAAPLVASCSTSAVYPTYYEALEALGRYRPNAKLAERINGAGEAKNY